MSVNANKAAKRKASCEELRLQNWLLRYRIDELMKRIDEAPHAETCAHWRLAPCDCFKVFPFAGWKTVMRALAEADT